MKVLVAGLGSIGQRHVRNLRGLFGDRVELLAYRKRGLPHVITDQMTIDASTSVEDRYGIRSFPDLAEALAERPLATMICNPTSLHVATARAAVEAGSHVFIEKPISDSWDGVEDLVHMAEQRRLAAVVGYQLRFHPALLRARALLASGAIGDVRCVEARWHEFLPDAHPYEDYRGSYAARRDLGGGVLLCYIHELDYLQWLFGTPVDVRAVGGRSGLLDVDVEDHAAVTLAFDAFEASCDLSFASRSRIRTCRIVGASGGLDVDLLSPRLVRTDARRRVVEDETFPGFARNDLFVDELRDFFRGIDGHPANGVSAREGLASLRLALSARAGVQAQMLGSLS